MVIYRLMFVCCIVDDYELKGQTHYESISCFLSDTIRDKHQRARKKKGEEEVRKTSS